MRNKSFFTLFLFLALFCLFLAPVHGSAGPLVLFDQSHGQRFFIEKNRPLDLSGLAVLFVDQGATVKVSRAPLTGKTLRDVDVLIIAGAFAPIRKAEIEAIAEFLERGGKLAVMIHIGKPFHGLLERLGVGISVAPVYEQPSRRPPPRRQRAFAFRAGKEWLALHSRFIKEVVEMGPIHSIPHKSSRIFRGLVNVRGRLELCVSIGGVLRIEPYPKPNVMVRERLVVAAKAGKSVVFPVSEVIGHVEYDKEALKPLPVTVSGSRAVYTKGIIAHGKRDIGLLDDILLFRILTRNLS